MTRSPVNCAQGLAYNPQQPDSHEKDSRNCHDARTLQPASKQLKQMLEKSGVGFMARNARIISVLVGREAGTDGWRGPMPPLENKRLVADSLKPLTNLSRC